MTREDSNCPTQYTMSSSDVLKAIEEVKSCGNIHGIRMG